MKSTHFHIVGCFLLVALISVLWSLQFDPRTESVVAAATTLPPRTVLGPIQPIPESIVLDTKKMNLGQRLFMDPRLSRDNTVACVDCHQLPGSGADTRRVSIGIDGLTGTVNAPTVLNSAYNFVQFWDGHATTLEEQIDSPLTNKTEMATNWDSVIEKLARDPDYVSAFQDAYSGPITASSVKNAIATFERSLITPNAPFDQYLRGDVDALTPTQKAGYQLFQELGCISCHQGVNIGGNTFQTMGKMGNYFADRGNITVADYGRFNVTGNERDRFKFKVPSLRNVSTTAPYFHDGSSETLEDAVRVMARYQLGYLLSDTEAELLVDFLDSLTGSVFMPNRFMNQ